MTQTPATFPGDEARPGWLSLPPMRYPNEYVWFLLLSALDITLTWVILALGGMEVNPIAWVVIEKWELPGAIIFKFSLMLLVIIVCEVVGRQRDRMARNLAQLSVIVSAMPVLWSLGLLALHVMSLDA